MIVDVHTHLWESPDQLGAAAASEIHAASKEPWDKPDVSIETYDRAMEPVDYAILLGFESLYLGAQISHEQIAGYVQRRPDKYFGFAGIDPMGSGAIESLDRARDLGLVGVTLSPAAQGFHPTHSNAMQLYNRCEQLGLPVMIHPGTHLGKHVKLEYSQPHYFDEVARAFPELRMVIGQVGYPWIPQALSLVSKHEHVYTDLTDLIRRPWSLYQALVAAHEHGAMDQLLFGSDFPFVSPADAIVTIYSTNTFTHGTHLPSIPREQLRGVIERDALSCLGLERPSCEQTDQNEALSIEESHDRCITITAVTPDDIRPHRRGDSGDREQEFIGDTDGAQSELTGVSDAGGEATK